MNKTKNQKIGPKFLNSSLVAAGPTGPSPVLVAGGRPSTRSPPGRPRESRKKHTLNQLLITLARGGTDLQPAVNCQPGLRRGDREAEGRFARGH